MNAQVDEIRWAPITQEIERLTASTRGEVDKQRFAYAVRSSVHAWQKRRLSPGADWLLLEAYLARIDASEDYSSIVYAEALSFCREMLGDLVHRDGLDYVAQCLHRTRLARRLISDPVQLRALALAVHAAWHPTKSQSAP